MEDKKMNMSKLNHLWQSATLVIAPALLVVLVWLRPVMDPFQWLLWLHLPLFMFHEAEEYVLSPLSFKEFINLKSPIGSGNDREYPLDEGYIFQVNILIAWTVIIVGAILAPIAPWVGFSMIWFELIINNVTHTIVFQREKPSYNPGLITNSFLLIPYGTWTLIQATGFFTWKDWVLSVILGLIISAILGVKTRGRLARIKKS
jgi:hypothetical protein